MEQEKTGSPARDIPPPAALMRLVGGFWVSAGVYAAAKLRVPDLLSGGPLDADEMAKRLDMHPGALYRLLRALASVGVFTEDGEGRFGLTPVGALLRTDVPGSLWAFVVLAHEAGWGPWGLLMHSIKTGGPAFEQAHGAGYFEYLKGNPEHARLFDLAMAGFVAANGVAVVDAYDFSRFSKVVDVGGGRGALMAAILRRCPATKGVVFDLPEVVEGAREALDEAHVSGRCELAGGDFFRAVPEGGDAYVLASITHDWDDDKASVILGNCRRAMGRQARLFLVEMVIPPGDMPSFGKLLDLTMLVNLGGRERTEAQYRDLLAAAGFRLLGVTPTKGPSSLIEAGPV